MDKFFLSDKNVGNIEKSVIYNINKKTNNKISSLDINIRSILSNIYKNFSNQVKDIKSLNTLSIKYIISYVINSSIKKRMENGENIGNFVSNDLVIENSEPDLKFQMFDNFQNYYSDNSSLLDKGVNIEEFVNKEKERYYPENNFNFNNNNNLNSNIIKKKSTNSDIFTNIEKREDERVNIVQKNSNSYTNELNQMNNMQFNVNSNVPIVPINLNNSLGVYYLLIDSKDRNVNMDKYPNDFTIDFSSYNINNVKSIELIECIIAKNNNEEENLDSIIQYPYILLDINGINNCVSSNSSIGNNFAILSNYKDCGLFKYYSNLNIKRYFDPNISLSKINVKFKNPSGNLIDFGFDNNSKMDTVITILFRIKLEN